MTEDEEFDQLVQEAGELVRKMVLGWVEEDEAKKDIRSSAISAVLFSVGMKANLMVNEGDPRGTFENVVRWFQEHGPDNMVFVDGGEKNFDSEEEAESFEARFKGELH